MDGNYDGKIVIGAELDSKNLEKQLKEQEKLLRNYQKEAENLTKTKVKSETDIQEYENALQLLRQMQEEEIKTLESESAKKAALEGYNQTMSILNQALELEKENLDEINGKIETNASNQELFKQRIQETQQSLSKTKVYDDIKAKVENIGNSVTSTIKKVGKWALAIFGLRSAYMFVRQAMSTLSQYNEQLATDVEYIRFALATTLQPIIEAIIKLVYQLLGLINSVAKALFGVDLFANASANAFKKANKSAGELKKTLAGFDKLNVLNENGSTGAVGGISPSVDLSQMEDADLSGVTKLLDKVKGLFNKAFDAIVGNAKKVLVDLGASPEFINAWEKTMNSIKQTFGGVIDFIVGLVKMLVGLLSGNTDLVVEGAKQAITGIKNFIVGLFNFIINIKDLTITAIKDGFNKIPQFFEGIKNRVVEIFKNMGTSVGSAVGDAFKYVINGVLSLVEYKLNKPINAINSLISLINTIPGISLGKMSTIKLPRLAQGGILNMPGHGVMVGSAIAGERGAEGVIPLTDEAALERIGNTIGKHVKINADITLELESRILARVMKEINSDRSFARNGG